MHGPGVQKGDGPEALHQARVATRRLRAQLGLLSGVLDPAWVAETRGELRWIASELGAVRDLDVLRSRFDAQGATLSREDRTDLNRLLLLIAQDRSHARIRLLDAMGSSRYRTLLDTFDPSHPFPFVEPGDVGTPALLLLRPFSEAALRRLLRAVRVAGDAPSDDDLHRIRRRTKDARYAAELHAAAAGKQPGRRARRLGELQGVLGALQDAVVAERWLRSISQRSEPNVEFISGALVALQRLDAQAARETWRRAYARVIR